jgi:flagellar basal body-associated protein FliL
MQNIEKVLKGKSGSAFVTFLVILIVLAGLACAGYFYLRTHDQNKLDKIEKQAKSTLHTVEKKSEAVKDDIMK